MPTQKHILKHKRNCIADPCRALPIPSTRAQTHSNVHCMMHLYDASSRAQFLTQRQNSRQFCLPREHEGQHADHGQRDCWPGAVNPSLCQCVSDVWPCSCSRYMHADLVYAQSLCFNDGLQATSDKTYGEASERQRQGSRQTGWWPPVRNVVIIKGALKLSILVKDAAGMSNTPLPSKLRMKLAWAVPGCKSAASRECCPVA